MLLAPHPLRFEVELVPDLVYGTGEVRAPRPGKKELKLDLYRPRGTDGLRPAVVLLHGGGWRTGDRKTYMSERCLAIASRGWVCASIDYRLVGDDPPGPDETPEGRTIAASIEDAEQAVRWLVANSGRYGVERDRFAVGGFSAGAGTALFLAYGPRGKGLPIRAALDFWGGMLSKVAWMESGEPPILIVHGTADPITEFSVAEGLAARAKAVGIPHELVRVEGGRHNLPLAPHYDRVAAFLERYLGSDRHFGNSRR